MPGFYEFFAGGGMARAGLGPGWTCLFANDFDARKGLTYQANWGAGGELRIGDVADVTPADLPGRPDLVWGSFPCQDLSLAGSGAGLAGSRSGSFYPFWNLIRALAREGRAPPLIALENVLGALTSHGGRDFAALAAAFAELGYAFAPLVIDAALFVPQSRPRLFIIGLRRDLRLHPDLLAPSPVEPFHSPALRRAVDRLPPAARAQALWLNLPAPPRRNQSFGDVIEDAPDTVDWHSQAQTDRILSLMTPLHLAKVEAAQRAGRRLVGGVYRRTRIDADGARRQRAEVRFDEVAGCLRTPGGGSSRQMIMVVDGPRVRTRLISARETARLMGLDDNYRLPTSYSEAYHLTGDGVCVHAVRHLARHVFEPVLGLANPRGHDQCVDSD